MERDGGTRLTWQQRRHAFNHDRLPLLFSRLSDGLSFLRGDFDEEGFAARLPERLITAWKHLRGEASRVAADFELEMSPRVCLNYAPLARVRPETREWLGAVVHGCWLARNGKRLLLDIRNAEREAEEAFLAVEARLSGIASAPSVSDVCPLLPELEALDQRCRALSAAISRLPGRVQVV